MSVLSVALERLGGPIWGVILPALIFLASFVLTYWLYRRFSRGIGEQQDQVGASDPPPGGSSGEEVQR